MSVGDAEDESMKSTNNTYFGLALTLSNKMNDSSYCFIALLSWYIYRPFTTQLLYFAAYKGFKTIKNNRNHMPIAFLKQYAKAKATLTMDSIKWQENDIIEINAQLTKA
jgi:hypothetical protein